MVGAGPRDWKLARAAITGANTTCVAVTNSHISTSCFGARHYGEQLLFSGNEIDRFGDDGIDYAASNILITHKNYVHDDLDLGNGEARSGRQCRGLFLACVQPFATS